MQPIRDLPMLFSAHFQLLNSEKLVGITGFVPSRSLENLVYVEKCIIYFHLIWSHCAGKPFIQSCCVKGSFTCLEWLRVYIRKVTVHMP